MKTLPNKLAAFPRYAATAMDIADLKELLEETDGWVFLQGYMWDIESESLGFGMCRVYLKKRD